MMVSQQTMMPKAKILKEVVVKVNKCGCLLEILTKEWLTMKLEIRKTNSIPAVIPGGHFKVYKCDLIKMVL